MLNAEKYKDKIKELNCRVAIDINSNELKHCNEMNCCNCKFRDNNCDRKKIKWLLEEYKEPILTDEEKEYLSAVIKPFKNSIQYIGKFKLDDGFQQIRITYVGEHYVSLIELPPFDKYMYEGMGIGKLYSLEELGL